MVVYFIISIINSLCQNYLNEKESLKKENQTLQAEGEKNQPEG